MEKDLELKDKKDKEVYQKPEIKSETVKMGVYGDYQKEPIASLQPFFGLCPPCQ